MLPARSLALAALLGPLVACGGEEPLRDDGGQGVPLAGQRQQLEDAGVEVLAAGVPVAASGTEVGAALEAVQLTAEEVDATEDGPVPGLVTARGDTSEFVVLVFDGPSSAALFADDAGGVLASEGTSTTVLAGNLVGVSSENEPLVRRALRGLAGV